MRDFFAFCGFERYIYRHIKIKLLLGLLNRLKTKMYKKITKMRRMRSNNKKKRFFDIFRLGKPRMANLHTVTKVKKLHGIAHLYV